MSPTGVVEGGQVSQGWSQSAESGIRTAGTFATTFRKEAQQGLAKTTEVESVKAPLTNTYNTVTTSLNGAKEGLKGVQIDLSKVPSQITQSANQVKNTVVTVAPAVGSTVKDAAQATYKYATDVENYKQAGKAIAETGGGVAKGIFSAIANIDFAGFFKAIPSVVGTMAKQTWSMLTGVISALKVPAQMVLEGKVTEGVMGICKELAKLAYDVALKPIIEDSGLLALVNAAKCFITGDHKKAMESLQESGKKFAQWSGATKIAQGIDKLAKGDGWGAWDVAVGIGTMAMNFAQLFGLGAAAYHSSRAVMAIGFRAAPYVTNLPKLIFSPRAFFKAQSAATQELSKAVGKEMVGHLGAAASKENLLAVGQTAAKDLRALTEKHILELAEKHGKDLLNRQEIRYQILQQVEANADKLGRRAVDQIIAKALADNPVRFGKLGSAWINCKNGFYEQCRKRLGKFGNWLADRNQVDTDDLSRLLQDAYKKEIHSLSKLSTDQIAEKYGVSRSAAFSMKCKANVIRIKGNKCKEYYQVIGNAYEGFAEELLERGLRQGFNEQWDKEVDDLRRTLKDKHGIKIDNEKVGDEFFDEMKIRGKKGFESGVKARVKELFERSFSKKRKHKLHDSESKKTEEDPKKKTKTKSEEANRPDEEQKKTIDDVKKKGQDESRTATSYYGTAYRAKADAVQEQIVEEGQKTHRRQVDDLKKVTQEALTRTAAEREKVKQGVQATQAENVTGSRLPRGDRAAAQKESNNSFALVG